MIFCGGRKRNAALARSLRHSGDFLGLRVERLPKVISKLRESGVRFSVNDRSRSHPELSGIIAAEVDLGEVADQ